MTLDDLEATHIPEVTEGFVGDDSPDPDEQILEDIQEGIAILIRTIHLLDYISDQELCKTITKRERQAMDRVAETIRGYLDSVGDTYNEVIEGVAE